ncbi:MAG TPA: hypothetical protein DDW80_07880 [Desulfovibrio sp.]|nr:hypothetical protein [Desulfovibrio sp.]
MSRIATLWQGRVPLWKAYWLYAVLGGLCVNILHLSLVRALFSARNALASLVILGAGLASLGYFVLMVVAVWRSAGRYRGFFLWPLLARIIVILNVLQFLGRGLG